MSTFVNWSRKYSISSQHPLHPLLFSQMSMTDTKVLDPTIIKDLLNHIYEKRKAAAFQIEGITKAALAQNDSTKVYQIIGTLTELSISNSVSAKMGAVTALGSVSVALGSFAIAYFLEDIVRPIFATFRDNDARVRYYACESLYNIAKIARGEILLYFNEVFDILCILVTDTESSVKNAADILDRLIKDIVSAKSTSYVSILHQQSDEVQDVRSNIITPDGQAFQVNNPQDPSKAFLLPRFIPTLLERMYIIDPFTKKFLLGWLELFDDIPSSELITFLPNFLEPLIRFFMNKCPSDVRIETQNLLNTFLQEMEANYKVKYELRKSQIINQRIRQKEQTLEGAPEESNSTESVTDSKAKSASSDELTKILSNTNHDPNDNDDSSIKSASTTIIRKPKEIELKHTVSESHSGVGHDVSEFISGQDIFVDYSRVISILLSFLCTEPPKTPPEYLYNDLSNEHHEICLEIQLTVLRWLQVIIQISPTSFSKFLPDCVSIIVRNVALTDDLNDVDLRSQFLNFDQSLRAYLNRLHESDIEELHSTSNIDEVSESAIQGLDKEAYDEFLELYLIKTSQVVLNECLLAVNELARLTSLDWMMFLFSNYRSSFFNQENNKLNSDQTKFKLDLTALLRSSVDSSKGVVSKVLTLAAQISEGNQEIFREFMVKLMIYFEAEGQDSVKAPTTLSSTNANGSGVLSREKMEFIIRRLCVNISAEKIFESLAEVLTFPDTFNAEFIGTIVVTLNNILLTSPELQGLRKNLRNFDLYISEDWALFSTLFKCWSYNMPSALSLCLLTSNYELAYLIIRDLADTEVSFQLLTQLDVLVQLLESHIFLKLRLQLLEPEKYHYLYKTLYGILMIMPQSSTYSVLQNRLSSLNLFIQSSVTAQRCHPMPSTIVPSSSSSTTQLSTKKKRIQELADTFVKVNERQQKSSLGKDAKDFHSRSQSTGIRYSPNRALLSSESQRSMQDYFPNQETKNANG